MEAGHAVIHVEGGVALVLFIERINVDIIIEDRADGFLLDRQKLISEDDLVGRVVEASDLEHADLNIHWERVKAHWAYKGYPTCDCVHQIMFGVNPEALQFR